MNIPYYYWRRDAALKTTITSYRLKKSNYLKKYICVFFRESHVTPLTNYSVIVGFLDGTVKECDMKPYFESEKKFGILLKNNQYFQHVSVQSGGYGIKWDHNLVVPSNLLYMMAEGRKD